MTRLNELKAGDKVRVTGFTCLNVDKPDLHDVHADGDKLYICCDEGRHYLDGQEDEPGADLVGVVKVE
jgi:hypothetical protein